MDKNIIRATNKTKKYEIVLNGKGGILPPLLQPATPEEQTAYEQAGIALANGSPEEARQILEKAGFSISNDGQ